MVLNSKKIHILNFKFNIDNILSVKVKNMIDFIDNIIIIIYISVPIKIC